MLDIAIKDGICWVLTVLTLSFPVFRFLRMRDFDVPKAKEVFLNYLKWREDYGVEAIAKATLSILFNCSRIFV